MTFANPQMLWLLLVFPPAMLAFFWWSWRARQKLMTQFIQARLLPGLTAGVSPRRQKIRAALLIVAVACLILALARPQWGYDLEEVTQRGLDIVVAIDTSKSMLAEDISPNRLARAKLAALELMQQAKSDRLGLVAFAGSAFLQCPLTIDDAAFRQSVQALDVNTIPEGGTALSDAIDTAQQAFKEGDNYKVLVLFTDGEDHEPGAVDTAKKAAEAGLKIFTIGIGSADGELLRVKNENGQSDYVRDENGNVVKSHLNEELLRQIAAAANGFYLPLRGANTIDTLYQQGLAPLPKSEAQEEKWVKRPHERYHWPLALAIALLLAEVLFPERRSPGRRGGKETFNIQHSTPNIQPPAVAAAVVLLLLPITGLASPSSALHAYQTGKYDEALKEYDLLMQKNPDDPRLRFNAAATQYRAEKFDEALTNFTAVTAAPELKLQQAAYYNLGNTQYQIGKNAKDLDALEETWKAAIQSYERALKLNTNDVDAAHNLAFVKDGVEQINQIREAARRGKAAADEAARRRNYHLALEIMQQLIQKNQAAKPFEDYAKRLQDIDTIATPRQP